MYLLFFQSKNYVALHFRALLVSSVYQKYCQICRTSVLTFWYRMDAYNKSLANRLKWRTIRGTCYWFKHQSILFDKYKIETTLWCDWYVISYLDFTMELQVQWMRPFNVQNRSWLRRRYEHIRVENLIAIIPLLQSTKIKQTLNIPMWGMVRRQVN